MRPRLILTFAVGAAAAVYIVAPQLAGDGDVVNAYNLSAMVSAVALVAGVAVNRPRPLWPWLLIAAALLLWVAGDVVYVLIGSPDVSVADVLYVAAYGSLIFATMTFLRLRMHRRDVDSAIDIAMVGAAALLVMWELIIEPTWQTPGIGVPGQLVAALYPVLDVVLLLLVAQLLLTPGRRLASAAILGAGLIAVLTGDVVYAVLQQTDAYDGAEHALDATWVVGYALLAIAAIHPSMTQLTAPVKGPTPFGLGRLLLAGCALVAVPGADVAVRQLGRDPGFETLALGSVTVVPLVLWRIVRLNRSTERARDAAARREAFFRAVAVNSSDTFAVVDATARVIDVSESVSTSFGVGRAAAIGIDALSLVHPDDQELGRALLSDTLTKPGVTITTEVRLNRADADERWIEIRCTNLLDDPAVGGIVINAHDITDRKLVEADLAHQAFHDSLTGLANRALLRDRIDHALSRRSRGSDDVIVMFCDIDGFKAVNDRLGHNAGDQVLEILAQRLTAAVRAGDTVARLGGDEFAVVLERSDADLEDVDVIAGRILSVLADPMHVEGTPLVVTGSVGIASARHGGQNTADELLRDADAAMYRAKAAGRNRFQTYERAIRAEAVTRAQLDSDLHGVVDRGELVAHYQPIVDLNTGRLVGFEALVRWNHPERGLLSPGEFIDIAEGNGAIVPIGAWILRTACRAARAWQQVAPSGEPIRVSVNLSARQIADGEIVQEVAGALRDAGLAPEALVLELTESVLVERPADVAERLRRLRALGVRIAVDDFGTGYSSLRYLQQFPIDILKIDRTFTATIDEAGHMPQLVRGLLDLGRTLRLDIVVEGIETDSQRRSLIEEGCDRGQGFLFARPVEESQTLALLHAPGLGTGTTSGPAGGAPVGESSRPTRR